MEYKINTEPLIDLSEAMKGLPKAVQENILRSVNRKLAKEHIVDVMKDEMPYSAKHRKDYTLITVRGDKTGIIAGIAKTNNSWYLLFPEKGTKERYAKYYRKGTFEKTGRKGSWEGRVKYKKPAYRGKVEAQNNFETIMDKGVPEIIKDFNTEIGDRILTEIEKRVLRATKKLNKI